MNPAEEFAPNQGGVPGGMPPGAPLEQSPEEAAASGPQNKAEEYDAAQGAAHINQPGQGVPTPAPAGPPKSADSLIDDAFRDQLQAETDGLNQRNHTTSIEHRTQKAVEFESAVVFAKNTEAMYRERLREQTGLESALDNQMLIKQAEMQKIVDRIDQLMGRLEEPPPEEQPFAMNDAEWKSLGLASMFGLDMTRVFNETTKIAEERQDSEFRNAVAKYQHEQAIVQARMELAMGDLDWERENYRDMKQTMMQIAAGRETAMMDLTRDTFTNILQMKTGLMESNWRTEENILVQNMANDAWVFQQSVAEALRVRHGEDEQQKKITTDLLSAGLEYAMGVTALYDPEMAVEQMKDMYSRLADYDMPPEMVATWTGITKMIKKHNDEIVKAQKYAASRAGATTKANAQRNWERSIGIGQPGAFGPHSTMVQYRATMPYSDDGWTMSESHSNFNGVDKNGNRVLQYGAIMDDTTGYWYVKPGKDMNKDADQHITNAAMLDYWQAQEDSSEKDEAIAEIKAQMAAHRAKAGGAVAMADPAYIQWTVDTMAFFRHQLSETVKEMRPSMRHQMKQFMGKYMHGISWDQNMKTFYESLEGVPSVEGIAAASKQKMYAPPQKKPGARVGTGVDRDSDKLIGSGGYF